jgi:hypothetical protein
VFRSSPDPDATPGSAPRHSCHRSITKEPHLARSSAYSMTAQVQDIPGPSVVLSITPESRPSAIRMTSAFLSTSSSFRSSATPSQRAVITPESLGGPGPVSPASRVEFRLDLANICPHGQRCRVADLEVAVEPRESLQLAEIDRHVAHCGRYRQLGRSAIKDFNPD